LENNLLRPAKLLSSTRRFNAVLKFLPSLTCFLLNPGARHTNLFPLNGVLKDGEVLAMAGDIEVIHSPGHCAGHVALLLRQDGVLIAGDICFNIMGLSYNVLNEEISLARRTILRVANYPFERAVFGHGKPLDKRANQQLKERFSDTKLR
jgi:glyoxylase-like metal-dependent hydrolase (beta-lactamase superfamily II)